MKCSTCSNVSEAPEGDVGWVVTKAATSGKILEVECPACLYRTAMSKERRRLHSRLTFRGRPRDSMDMILIHLAAHEEWQTTKQISEQLPRVHGTIFAALVILEKRGLINGRRKGQERQWSGRTTPKPVGWRSESNDQRRSWEHPDKGNTSGGRDASAICAVFSAGNNIPRSPSSHNAEVLFVEGR